MYKKYLIILGLVIVTVVIWYRFKQTSETRVSYIDNESTINIVTSFYPIYYFTSRIVGDRLQVKNLTPVGTEPHEYELSTNDVASLEKARLIIINGGGMEKWQKNINVRKDRIVETGEGLFDRNDPHIWLDPNLASIQVDRIYDALIKIDPQDEHYFTANVSKIKSELKNLDNEYSTSLANCDLRTVVTSHDAFGYLAKRYLFRQLSIVGLSPEEEPSPKKMAEISDFAKKEKVKYIFFETLLNSRLAETIAKEAGISILVFNPLEGLTKEEIAQKMDYFTIQRNNIKNLELALSCSK